MTANAQKVLVIDDEASIRRLLKLNLEEAQFHVLQAVDGREGLHLAAAERPDIIILDMGLPDQRGLEVLRALRQWSETPVVILSVEDDPDTIIQALDAGADDYVTKPFRSGELLARLKACLRRSFKAAFPQPQVRIGNIHLDLGKRGVTKDGVSVKLTATEYDLLVYLVKNRGKVVTHAQILKSVWGPQAPADSSYPRVYMRHLRLKLEDNPEAPAYFLTELGVGYRLKD